MKTVSDLKQFLQEMIENLEMNYDDDQELDLKGNTYWVKSSTFLGTREGFIDLREPVEADNDEEEDDD